MKVSKSYDEDKGILYLVGTPIGNMGDMSYRAIEALKTCDYIFCEDTRVSKKLLNYFSIDKPLNSYYEYNKDSKNDYIISLLQKAFKVALISDAGNPVISDPGFEIVKLAIENNISVSPISGPSAFVSTLIASGINPKPHTFYGFLDHKKTKRVNELEELKTHPYTIIFYESIHRIKETLNDIYDVLGDRYICIGRELTKQHEEFIYGYLQEVKEYELTLKGEIVIVVAPQAKTDIIFNVKKEVDFLVASGMKSKEAIKIVAKRSKRATSDVYKEYYDI